MKQKMFASIGTAVLLAGLLAGCGGGNAGNGDGTAQGSGGAAATPAPAATATPAPAETGKFADGVYYAEAAGFAEKSGWKEIVGLKVEGGKIVSVDWNGLHKDGGLDKKTSSEKGIYGMTKGGAQAEWHEQAAKAEQFLLDKQDPAAIVVKEDGKTDAISGVSITVGEFASLVNEALEAGPVEAGPYKDGTYHAEQAEFDAKSGWKYTADITVLNGKIIAADWNGVHKDGGDDKDTVSESGAYGLVAKGGAQAEWHEQALLAEQYLIEKQDPAAITYTDDEGHTDAISGVSIHVVEFFELAAEALASAK